MDGSTNYYLTPSEAAEHLRVAERTVRKWARAGKLKGRKLPDGRWLFTKSDLDAAVSLVGS